MESAALSRRLLMTLCPIPKSSKNSHQHPKLLFNPKPIKCSSIFKDINSPANASSNSRPCSAICAYNKQTDDLFSSSSSSDPASRLRLLVSEFQSLPQPLDRVKRLLDYAASLPPFPDPSRSLANRVMGCTAQVWLSAALAPDGTLRFAAGSDSEIAKGFCACLISVLEGATPEQVLMMRPENFEELNVVGVPGRVQSRVNTWHNVLISMQKRAKMLLAAADGRVLAEPFPSLVIAADGAEAKGSYAEAKMS